MEFGAATVVIAQRERDPLGIIVTVAVVLLAIAFALWLLNRRRNDQGDDGTDEHQ